MKCPQCIKNNQTSRCFRNNVSNATVSPSEYWDEDGIFHRHDPNWVHKSFHCSRGHVWTIKGRRPCPACNFGHVTPETRIINPS